MQVQSREDKVTQRIFLYISFTHEGKCIQFISFAIGISSKILINYQPSQFSILLSSISEYYSYPSLPFHPHYKDERQQNLYFRETTPLWKLDT